MEKQMPPQEGLETFLKGGIQIQRYGTCGSKATKLTRTFAFVRGWFTHAAPPFLSSLIIREL